MKDFDDSTYGDAFADVYDDWYATVSDIDATVATLRHLGGQGRYLELGVGTGRLALALAGTGARVTGIDASRAMLDRLAEKNDASGPHLDVVHGDMVDDQPPGPFEVVFIAYNTLFSLRSRRRQQALFDMVATRLAPGGSFVVEAAVPDPQRPAGGTVGVRSLSADRVVLSVDVHDPTERTVDGQFIEFTESDGIRLRPWSIRYCSPAEMDDMARAAGLELRHRWSDMQRSPFDETSSDHVSVYSF
ncbi:MAG: class I SAM-dependent DNA methyltransferase [Actinomycetota bacterium]